MDTIRKIKLQKYRDKIVDDLDVECILEILISNQVITDDEAENIMSETTRHARVRHLLDILSKKDSVAFDNFVKSLLSDYRWLHDELTADSEPNYEEAFLDALLLGGIPRTPPHNVERSDMLQQLRESLHSLKRGRYIVLHGMTGSGKSCLAAASVEYFPLIIHSFKSCIFWISVGESENDILSHMVPLLHKLEATGKVSCDEFQKQDVMNLSWVCDTLKRYYTHQSFREGLLILDDVTSSDVIEAFDIGCKILVTTKDLEVMKKVRGRVDKIFKLNDGFTERETLSLFAKCIGASVDDLPKQAKEIHRICKGFPMLVALIGANLEDNVQDACHSDLRWKYYITMLMQKRYSPESHGALYQRELFNAIGMSISYLPDKQKQKFQDFALFDEDVNIKPEVLQTLWSINKYEVEDIMSHFVKKSLAVSKWNEDLNSIVYGIHDIILHYLKSNLAREKKVNFRYC